MRFWAVMTCGAVLAATPALADPRLNGTWKIDQGQMKLDPKTDDIDLRSGSYRCRSCEPPYSVKADGRYHPVERGGYVDAQRVTLLSRRAIRSEVRRGGAVTGGATYTVSPDNRMLTTQWWTVDNAQKRRVTGTNRSTRVARGGAGGHAISGSWRPLADKSDLPPESLTMSFLLAGDQLTMTQLTGERVTMQLGGPKARIEGDATESYTKATRIDADTIVIESFLKDEPKGTATIRLNPDGTITVTERSPAGRTSSFVARRQ